MFNREKTLQSGEKITITSRLDPDGTERLYLCISSKDKDKGLIIDFSVHLTPEESRFLITSMQAAETMLRLNKKEK